MKTYSKVSNQDKIGLRFKVLGFLIPILIVMLSFLYLIKISIPFKFEIQISISILLIICCILFLRIRFFELDSSGEVISIRYYHPVFTNLERRSEFPKDKLQDFKIENNHGTTLIKIYLKMLEKKTVSLHYAVRGFNSSTIQILKNNLQRTKDDYQIQN